MSRAKQMGTAVETAALRYARERGFAAARRQALAGSGDIGDIELLPAATDRGPVIIECKRAHRGVQLTGWMRQTAVERANAGASFALLVAKQLGMGDRNVGSWFAACTVEDWIWLQRRHWGGDMVDDVPVWPNRSVTHFVENMLPMIQRLRTTGEYVMAGPYGRMLQQLMHVDDL